MSLLHLQLPDQLRLLLVDDHRLFLEGLALVLQPLSRAVHIDLADSAAAADQLRRQHDYDLILLDLRLPDRSGLQLLRDWQQAGNPTPVAVLSASESPADMQAALQAGALGFIAKSSDAQSLRSAISRLLLGECLPLPLPLAGNPPAGNPPAAGRRPAQQKHQSPAAVVRGHREDPPQGVVPAPGRAYPYRLRQRGAPARSIRLSAAGR